MGVVLPIFKEVEGTPLPLCKDCKYFRHSFDAWLMSPLRKQFARCAHPAAVMEHRNAEHLIAGGRQHAPEPGYCSTQRSLDYASTCGPLAKWFDPLSELL